jgi:hypothetical protein
VTIRYCVLGFVFAIAVACGGSKPTGPTPVPDPGPVVTNAPPVIGKFTVQSTRANAPANFADVLEDVPISVEVSDPEPSSNELKFNWAAAVGTFSGTGRSVTWKAPVNTITPVDVVINLEVVETYISQGKNVDNVVKASTNVRLHNSSKEVGDMAVQFLLDFSTSVLPTNVVMRNFEPDCYGTRDEIGDVNKNRSDFNIIDYRVDAAVTTVRFLGTCAFRNKPGDACARVPVYWKSVAKKDLYNSSGVLALRAGERTEASGFDQLAAKYYPTQKRWWLCDSQFDGTSTSLVGSSRALLPLRGLVP